MAQHAGTPSTPPARTRQRQGRGAKGLQYLRGAPVDAVPFSRQAACLVGRGTAEYLARATITSSPALRTMRPMASAASTSPPG
jgi:hypothetical protein